MKIKNKFARIVLDSTGRQVVVLKTFTDEEDLPYGLETTAFLNGLRSTATYGHKTESSRNKAFKDYDQAQADILYGALEKFF